MNINKMTEKLQQGLVNAQSLATSLNHQEIDTAHERGFARPGKPDNAENFSVVNPKRNVVDGCHRS